MQTARRYLAREIYRSTSVVLIALLGLFTFFTLVDELDTVNARFPLSALFYLQGLSLPTRLYDLLPIGLLIGAILALSAHQLTSRTYMNKPYTIINVQTTLST